MVRIELELLHLGNVDLRCLTFRRISVYLLKVRMSIKDTDARNKMIKLMELKVKWRCVILLIICVIGLVCTVVSISHCGCDDPGSIPGLDKKMIVCQWW